MRRALVFAHFDPHGIVDAHVLHALACHRQYFEMIVFVSTAELDVAQQRLVAALVDRTITRANVGYDFCSWRVGFESIPQPGLFDGIAFVNDSCYGPLNDVARFWHAAASSPADLWGASINHQFGLHVQSYCMVFGAALVRSGFARRFWTSVEDTGNKMDLILQYEVGLSRQVEAAGYTTGALIDFRDGGLESRHRVVADTRSFTDPVRSAAGLAAIAREKTPDPMQRYWLESFRQGLPFMKVELVRHNYVHANLASIYAAITEPRWYDVALVRHHLSRFGPCGSFPPPPGRTNAGLVDPGDPWA